LNFKLIFFKQNYRLFDYIVNLETFHICIELIDLIIKHNSVFLGICHFSESGNMLYYAIRVESLIMHRVQFSRDNT